MEALVLCPADVLEEPESILQPPKANAMTMNVAIGSRAADTPNFRMLSPM
jgi:hypothetical protein